MTTNKEARFHDDSAAREHLEAIRWPKGPVCPHCGGADRQSKLEGKAHRPGLYFCGHCRQQYTVTVGTVFERSKIPLHKWVYANHLLCSSKKGMSSLQLSRMLKVTYKTAWFMTHRIREAMTTIPTGQLGGGGKVVEADETYWGNKKHARRTVGYEHKQKIFSLVERGGNVRSFHVANVTGANLKPILRANVKRDTSIYTDEHGAYHALDREFASHEKVNHSAKEYARGPIHTNTIEGYFSILKRGLIGTYHHVSEQHLQRYVSEFDFRYNHRQSVGIDDEKRAVAALKGIEGKRLTYRRINGAP